MKEHVLILVFLLSAANLLAQFSGNNNTYKLTGPQSVFKSEIPLVEPSVIGSTYLDEEWHNARIVLNDGYAIEDLPVRIEVEQANVEIKYNGEVKYLDLKRVSFINYDDGLGGDRKIIKQADGYIYDNAPLKGIVVVHAGARYDVIKHFYIEFLQANYNVAMDVGSKDHRKVKKEKLYLAKGSHLILVKGSEKKITSRLGADEEKARLIIREHKLNLSKEEDLGKLADLL